MCMPSWLKTTFQSTANIMEWCKFFLVQKDCGDSSRQIWSQEENFVSFWKFKLISAQSLSESSSHQLHLHPSRISSMVSAVKFGHIEFVRSPSFSVKSELATHFFKFSHFSGCLRSHTHGEVRCSWEREFYPRGWVHDRRPMVHYPTSGIHLSGYPHPSTLNHRSL